MKFREHQRFTSVSHPPCRSRVATVLFTGMFFLLLLSNFNSYAQADSNGVDIASIRFFRSEDLHLHFEVAVQPMGSVQDNAIGSLSYQRLRKSLPTNYIEKDIFERFTLTNSSDSVRSVFFLPGFYCKDIRLFSADSGNLSAPPVLIPDTSNLKKPLGARLITLQPHETRTFYCRFNFMRSNVNNIIPRLIEKDYFRQWRSSIFDGDYLLNTITYVATGILLMMIFYSLAVYLQSRAREFIFYALYTFCTAALLFLKSFLTLSGSDFHFFYEEYLDFMVMTASVFTYLFFVRQFLNTKVLHPQLDRFMRWAKGVLTVFFIIYSLLYFFTDKYVVLNILENVVMKGIFLVIGIVFIVFSIKKKDTLLNYLALGNLSLVIFSLLSLLMMQFKLSFTDVDSRWNLLNRSLLYYEIGLVLELAFFLSGLAYKNRRDIVERVKERERLKLENERKEFEKQMAVVTAMQGERDRISADMHDELGSGVTAIRLMSEILKTKMKSQSIPELEKISSSANELLGKMNTIIWTMKSSNDTVESLVAYIRAHAIEYFDSTPIDCTVKLPALIPQADISGEKRRNIFLSVKESLNNAMKHSQATHLQIDISTKDNSLIIRVSDNGVGINTEQLRRFGNGLSNMRRRMESIGGSFLIESNKEQCTVTFEAPL
jgi:signal transduction histidine kinase